MSDPPRSPLHLPSEPLTCLGPLIKTRQGPGVGVSGVQVRSQDFLVHGSMDLSIHNWQMSSWKGDPRCFVFGETPGVRLLPTSLVVSGGSFSCKNVPEAWWKVTQGVYTTSSTPSHPLQTLHLLGFPALFVHLSFSRAILLFFRDWVWLLFAITCCLSYSYSALSFLPLPSPLLHHLSLFLTFVSSKTA